MKLDPLDASRAGEGSAKGAAGAVAVCDSNRDSLELQELFTMSVTVVERVRLPEVAVTVSV